MSEFAPSGEWVRPSVAASRVSHELSITIEMARKALAVRATACEIVTIAQRFDGHLPAEMPVIPDQRWQIVWPSFWGSELARNINCELWTVGDVEFFWEDDDLRRPFRMFDVRFRSAQIDDMLAGRSSSSNDNNEKLVQVQALLPKVRSLSPKWDWEAALIELVRVAHTHPDGLHSIPGFDPPKRGSSARLEEWFAAFFGSGSEGEGPAESERRSRAQAVLDAIKGCG